MVGKNATPTAASVESGSPVVGFLLGLALCVFGVILAYTTVFDWRSSHQPIKITEFIWLAILGEPLFRVACLATGIGFVYCGVILFWIAFDRSPIVHADRSGLLLHPSYKRNAVLYDEIRKWSFVQNQQSDWYPALDDWTLKFELRSWYLSPRLPLIPMRAIKLKGTQSDFDEIVELLLAHPEMAEKFVPAEW